MQILGMSPSSRRAWIEIRPAESSRKRRSVALLTEGVDRNIWRKYRIEVEHLVARLTEGVDRNKSFVGGEDAEAVALLTEGVDRNTLAVERDHKDKGRPPHGGRG